MPTLQESELPVPKFEKPSKLLSLFFLEEEALLPVEEDLLPEADLLMYWMLGHFED